MFSIFPALLDFHLFAALLLRVVIGYVFIMHGKRLYDGLSSILAPIPARALQCLAWIQGIVGILLIAGAWVQGAALVGAIVAFLGIESSLSRESTANEREVLLLLWAGCLSLLVLGAGPYAMDIPL